MWKVNTIVECQDPQNQQNLKNTVTVGVVGLLPVLLGSVSLSFSGDAETGKERENGLTKTRTYPMETRNIPKINVNMVGGAKSCWKSVRLLVLRV